MKSAAGRSESLKPWKHLLPDHAAFERLVMVHLDAGHNLARWLTRDASDAEDVVQDACLRAMKYMGTLHAQDGRAWFLTIVRRAFYDWLARNRPALLANERQFAGYFKGQKGGRGQAEQDSYVTSMVNSMSSFTTTEGAEFCGRNASLFDEVLALRSGAELAPYAAGKNLYPASFGACLQNAAPTAPATRRATAPTKRK